MSSSAPKKKPGRPRTKGVAAPAPSRASTVKRSVTLDDLPAIQVEGGLFTIEHVRKVQRITADHQAAAQYDLAPGLELKQEISRAFTIGAALWADFESSRAGAGDKTEATRRFLDRFLKDVLGFADLRPFVPRGDGPQHYPLTFQAFAKAVPLVLAGAHQDIDKPDDAFGDGFRRRSPHQLLQEYLNWDEGALWGICSNGTVLRILRDSDSLTRQSCFEANLERIFGEELLADFSVLWLHAHASRFKPDVAGPASCILEQWHQSSQEEGSRVRDSLRIGVERAMVDLGTGFLEHRSNAALRDALSSGAMRLEDFHQEVLRLVYRMLFLLAVEDRRQLHPASATKEQLDLYAQGYSLTRLRQRSIRHCADRHDDIWDSLRVAFRGLAKGEPALALPALGGLFADSQCPTIDKLLISNKRLLAALRAISWFRENDALVPVNYKSMGTEELGSVYESLLELTPSICDDGKSFGFITADEDEGKGNSRKTSGSYYTPDSLVQQLLDTALDPVVEDRLRGKASKQEREAALLSISVIDPACGSGHFLLGAARRLAEKLAKVRADAGEVTDYRSALRDVIASCIYGVDRNPMAIQLAKVALWLEGYVADKPLSFLDHHLVVGDSILSVIDLDMVKKGIPDDAYDPVTLDDKAVAKSLRSANRKSRENDLTAARQGTINLFAGTTVDLGAEFGKIDRVKDDNLSAVADKSTEYERYKVAALKDPRVVAAKLYMGAYLMPKVPGGLVPTSQDVVSALNGDDIQRVLEPVEKACQAANVLIWPAAFPGVFAKGGFDVVLGNPPWERITLKEKEFFATRSPAVATARNKAERAAAINRLRDSAAGTVERRHFDEFLVAKRISEVASAYAHDVQRFPLTGQGDVNLYALFAENFKLLIKPEGRAGFLAPTGIATDKSTSVFFSALMEGGSVGSLYDFENKRGLFKGVHKSFKFCLMTLGKELTPKFAFMLHDVSDLKDSRRILHLTAAQMAMMNPNTKNAPVIRSAKDAEVLAGIYARLDVLVKEAGEAFDGKNAWGLRFLTQFHSSGDSGDFVDEPSGDVVPVYESKMINLYDHRWSQFAEGDAGDDSDESEDETEGISLSLKQNPDFTVRPRYWISRRKVLAKISDVPDLLLKAYRSNSSTVADVLHAYVRAAFDLNPHRDDADFGAVVPWYVSSSSGSTIDSRQFHDDLSRMPHGLGEILAASSRAKTPDEALDFVFSSAMPKWLFGWRKITNTTNRRTLICSAFPASASVDSIYIARPTCSPDRALCLLAQWSSLPCDYVARNKVGGTNFSYGYFNQMPSLRPDQIPDNALSFIVTRALELAYVSHDMKGIYDEVVGVSQGYDSRSSGRGSPYAFELPRRHILKSELDAYIGHLWGLTRDEMRFILDPKELMGPDYPSETFRGLRDAEIKEFGEYRTQRLVLEAWDRIVEPLRRGKA